MGSGRLRLVRGLFTWVQHGLKFFMNHAAQHRLKRPMPVDVLPQGIVDQGLVIAAALMVNLLLKPSQDVLIQADRNARFGGGHRIERASLGPVWVIGDFGDLVVVMEIGIGHNIVLLFGWRDVPK